MRIWVRSAIEIARKLRVVRTCSVTIGCLIAAAGLVLWIIHAAADRTDQISIAHEERLADNGFELRKQEVRKAVVTETVWDDAVSHLDLSFDPVWAEANMVAFFRETHGYKVIYVVASDGRLLLGRAPGAEPMATWRAIQPEIAPLIASIRAREAGLHRQTRGLPSRTLISDPVDAVTVAFVSGVPHIILAALVQPDFGHALPSSRAPIVVVGEAIDTPFLTEFGKAYLLRDVRLTPKDARPDPLRASLPIRDAAGKLVARADWAPELPGEDLLRHSILPLSVLLLALTALSLALIIWERRRTVQLQDARDAASAASLAKSEFLANMSHELRTPLNGVLGISGALARTELSAKQREMVELVSNSAKTLEALLSDILDLARVESGAVEIADEPFDLETSVMACAALFDAAAQAKGLDLNVSIDEAAKGAYSGDAARLRQVLSNLLGNAVKFTSAGHIALEVAALRGETTCELTLRVRDTGIGFDRETADRLFARFEQGDGSITRRFGGSGLGLAISRSLARAMGGDLEAASQPGVGSVFSLHLTLRRCSGPVKAWDGPAAVPEPRAGGLRVLVAEDHPTNRKVVELILEAAGVELTCVEDGAQAVAAFLAGGFDLVLMDMQMPVMDGLTAIREIRAREAERGGRRTPIVVLTANAMPDHVVASTEAGADGHLSKPITPDRLLEVVARTVGAQEDRPRPAAAS
ncbi:MAG TPA: ATP-binding protein [Phenylobacterium sp.]|uniref:hybrid sensor histidine kinase/response regulator n=1 Tax=Phenylobacterium sp. TaxID=1871053 RepID=UPI002B46C2D8|nr:ATP-binding protein [Phenylobacterium sp.]HKR90527.1 ATP-binding protein [Phenylobacterium sp.]